MRTPLPLLLALPLAACTRAPATRPPAARSVAPAPSVASPERPRPLIDESSAEETIERTHEVSPYPGDERGLEALVRALSAAASDPAALDLALRPVMPRRGALRLALTFEGGRELVPFLTGPAAATREDVARLVRPWAGARAVTVRGATGAQIARGEAVGAYNPALRRLGPQLREGAKFYRVELAFADGRAVVSESWVYAGGRWMYLHEPWRFAAGSPERGALVPSVRGATGIPAGGLR